MIFIQLLHPRVDSGCFGLIPSFLAEADPRPAAEQFNDRYQGGWRPQEGITIKGSKLCYPGDPPQPALAQFQWRDETIVLYPHEYVGIFQRDGSYEVCRMD